jgi:hypothetical protein
VGRNRFVEPRTVRLPLTDGDWIEVKDELTVGETKTYEASGLGAGGAIDWPTYYIARVCVYLQDWSLRDAQDKPVDVSREAVSALDTDTFTEIENAISAHRKAKADAKKKLTETSPTSRPSPSAESSS